MHIKVTVENGEVFKHLATSDNLLECTKEAFKTIDVFDDRENLMLALTRYTPVVLVGQVMALLDNKRGKG